MLALYANLNRLNSHNLTCPGTLPKHDLLASLKHCKTNGNQQKMTIYTHPKTHKSSKYVSFIHKLEPPEFAQLEPFRNASEARVVGVAQTVQNK